MVAVRRVQQDLSMIEYLIEHGADLDLVDSVCGM
jgi:hypothetical protein